MAKECKICDRLVARKYKKGGPVESHMLQNMDESDIKNYHSLDEPSRLHYSNEYLKGIDEKAANGLLDQEYDTGGPVTFPTMDEYNTTVDTDATEKAGKKAAQDKNNQSLSKQVSAIAGLTNMAIGVVDSTRPEKANVGGQTLSGAMTGASFGSTFGELGIGIGAVLGAGIGFASGGIKQNAINKQNEEIEKEKQSRFMTDYNTEQAIRKAKGLKKGGSVIQKIANGGPIKKNKLDYFSNEDYYKLTESEKAEIDADSSFLNHGTGMSKYQQNKQKSKLINLINDKVKNVVNPNENLKGDEIGFRSQDGKFYNHDVAYPNWIRYQHQSDDTNLEENQEGGQYHYSKNLDGTFQKETQSIKKGGVIQGPGTGKSDDVSMKASPKDFIIPADAMKLPVVKQLMKELKLDKVASKKSGNVKIKASNGEGLIPKNLIAEASSILKSKGLSLDALAPEAENKTGKKDGGKVAVDTNKEHPTYRFWGGGEVSVPLPGTDIAFEYDPTTQRTKIISSGPTKDWSFDNLGKVYDNTGKNVSHQDYMKKAEFGKTGNAKTERDQIRKYYNQAVDNFKRMNNTYDESKSYDKQSQTFKDVYEKRQEENRPQTIADIKNPNIKGDNDLGLTEKEILDSQKGLSKDQKDRLNAKGKTKNKDGTETEYYSNPNARIEWARRVNAGENTPDDFDKMINSYPDLKATGFESKTNDSYRKDKLISPVDATGQSREEFIANGGKPEDFVPTSEEEISDEDKRTIQNTTGASINDDKGSDNFELTESQQRGLTATLGLDKPVIRDKDGNVIDTPVAKQSNTNQYGFNVADLLATGQIIGGLIQTTSQGKEPEYEISKDILGVHNRANAEAQYGFTPAQLSQQEGKIAQNTADATGITNKLAMGSAGSAYGMALNNLLTKNKAELDLKIADDAIKFKKQGYADSYARVLAEEHRFKYSDKERKYERDVNAGSDLLNAGIGNLIGSQKLKYERDFYKNLSSNNTILPG